jgi:hypothetical protein
VFREPKILFDEFMSFRSGMVYRNGVSHDATLAPVRNRFSDATVFVLDTDAVTMVANVSLSKPSSILSALPFTRLPFPKTWIEWAAEDMKKAMAELGSPNRVDVDEGIRIERVGFLIQELPRKEGEPRRLVAEYVHRDRFATVNKGVTDLSPARLIITVPDDLPDPDDVLIAGDRLKLVDEDMSGRVRDLYRQMESDPYEMACYLELHDAFQPEPHPDAAPIIGAAAQMMGPERAQRVVERQKTEARRQANLLLPALILLNTRNAVETEVVPAPEKLNKSRAKKKLAPLVEHRIVRLKLSRSQNIRSKSNAEGARAIRGTLVRGHFKVMRNGIFWWNAFARRGYGAVTKSYVVTP